MASALPSPSTTVHPSPSATPAPTSPKHKASSAPSAASTTPLGHISQLASKNSSVLAIFDTAKLAGFPLPAEGARSSEGAKVWELQSRLGAGSSLVGYLRASAPSASTFGSTALIATPTLGLLVPSLSELPEVTTKQNRLVVHVSVSLPAADRPLDAPSPSLAQITPLLALLPESFVVVFSGSAEDAVRNATAIYEDQAFEAVNVLHVVEGVFAARETVRTPSVGGVKGTLETFTYSGSEEATKIVVVPSSYSSALLRSAKLPPSVGILTVNVLGPWPSASLLGALPGSGKQVTSLVVLEEVDASAQATSLLKDLVVGSVFGAAGTSSGKIPSVTAVNVSPAELDVGSLVSALGYSTPAVIKNNAKQTVLYTSPSSLLPHLLTKTFLSSPALQTRVSTLTSTLPAIAQSTIVLSSSENNKPFAAKPAKNSSAVIVITAASALNQASDAFRSLVHGGSVLISIAGWDKAAVEDNLNVRDRKFLVQQGARVFVLPPIAEGGEKEETGVALVGFFALYSGVGQGGKFSAPVKSLLEAILGEGGDKLVAEGEEALAEVTTSGWSIEVTEEDGEEKRDALVLDGLTSYPSAAPSNSSVVDGPIKSTWHNPALHLLFKESFAPLSSETASIQALAPSVHDKTYLATVTENRRLTPTSYDRNVFHLELSTAGTGLTYAVGEALGVHGHNYTPDVLEFLEWYGVDPNAIISVKLPSGEVETRTALQMFVQQVDIFGRPPKGFYAALESKTKNREEQRTLRFISAPEGSSMFRKWSEVETVTYADVLKRFPGVKAQVSIEELVTLVGEIHPRHYSISSAQKFVGDSVHLLVVTVEWDTPAGRPRYGQCTRYLADLKLGEHVTVSIKPSVMKLPPLDTQPVIMAGLGTGAAPFRAFIQHRAWQRSQGLTVGPLVYYFGARYSSQEYLYGEEIEAYLRGGVLTHAGLAFSRDTNKKVYIQHKMLEDGPMLSDILTAEKEEDKAYFYLCGPTWPVPDVYEALVGSLEGNKGVERKRAEEMIEEWKEEERYVLEVY